MTSIAWPESYNIGGSIRREQINNFSGIMPTRFDTCDSFLEKIGNAIQIAFYNQTQQFYQEMLDRIVAVGDTHKKNVLKDKYE